MRTAVTAALSLAVLAGCGSQAAPESAPESAAGSAVSKSAAPEQGAGTPEDRRIQQVKADCMKQKGFTYIPFVPQPQKRTETERKSDEGDYAAMRKLRAKYGFQVFAAHVYPDDPASGALVVEALVPDPNSRVLGALNSTQFGAYKKAEEGCFGKALKEVLHKEVPVGGKFGGAMGYFQQRQAKAKQLKERELDGDPRLVEPAASFGDCLKAKGYPVTSLKPTTLAERGWQAFWAEEKKFPRGKDGNPPDLTPAQARPYLVREVKAALDDLECGKDFYAVYMPKKREIDLRVNREFGEAVG
ncbi:hypothetical protein ACQPYK_47400 [Streptosporangium sp. CA-135522]|uniref:hypothetical protein n=1 Tax=Streptosporangium sp. CA-135522 TaxID=3240072 RepID=UPI003D8BDD75